MNKEEKNDFTEHQKKYSEVMAQVYFRARIPWQLLIRQADPDPRLEEWFDPKVLEYVRMREEQRLFAERAGKIIFNMNAPEDHTESDPFVIQGRQNLKNILGK